MIELSGEQLDVEIAKIAGLVEGKDYGDIQHITSGEHCARCGMTLVMGWKEFCWNKSPPRYHESLDLLLPVVRKTCVGYGTRAKFIKALKARRVQPTDPHIVSFSLDSLWWLIFMVDNPAGLLCESLIEAVGGKE